ncbi:MAG: redox-regulated ATPase YchF [Anaerolineae bacterium]
MQLGLIGLPMSGKTTIFNALTGSNRPTSVTAPGKLDVQMAVVDVPDPRLDKLYDLFHPQKKVPAKITFIDIGGLTRGISEGGLSGPFRNELSQMDAFLHVVREFDDPNVPHVEGSINPQRDLEILDTEFLLADLIVVENRIARIKEEMGKGKNRAANAEELALFEQLKEALEAETALRELDLDQETVAGLRGYGFLTLKPRLVLLNMGDALKDPPEVIHVPGKHTKAVALLGKLEMEIAQLGDEDAALFMEEYGITELMRDRIIRESYNLLGVQTFFTVGEDEVRAWPHPIGATAQQGAGKIHTDLERGFIRAEIIPWDVLLEAGGMAEARHAGKLRLEGKNYILQDGDVMTVRFNV